MGGVPQESLDATSHMWRLITQINKTNMKRLRSMNHGNPKGTPGLILIPIPEIGILGKTDPTGPKTMTLASGRRIGHSWNGRKSLHANSLPKTLALEGRDVSFVMIEKLAIKIGRRCRLGQNLAVSLGKILGKARH